MNVYDFDQTIFYPDSSYCFVMYCLRHYPRAVLSALPETILMGILVLLKQADTRDLKEKVFSFLVMFDHLEPKYWLAAGAVQQVKKNFEKAKAAYVQAAMLDIHGPKPQYYVAECYLALGQKDDALASLETLLEYCNGQDEVTKEFRAKAEALKKKILG